MSSNLSQFHFLASTVPNKFDFEAEDFDVGQIYQFYSLKVSPEEPVIYVLILICFNSLSFSINVPQPLFSSTICLPRS